MKKYKKTLQEINMWIEDYIEAKDICRYALKENSSTIYLNLCDQPIYQEYSGNKILHEQIISYLRIKILFPEEMKAEEQQNIKKMLQLHYAIEFQEINRKILRTNIKGTISLFLGALLFFIFGILEWYKVNFIFQGIIEIFSWVFIWEACDSFAFTNSENRLRRLRLLNLYRACQNIQDF